MRKKEYGKKVISIILAASMIISMAACGGDKAQDTQQTVSQETVQTEVSTEAVDPETTTALEAETASKYSVTEENGNKELTMARQPEASYWFPAQLLEWKAADDEDLIFNVSTVPLAKRADIASLETVNATQNKDTQIMAISIMNGSTSGNSPHGLNKAEANAFSYWQYVDLLVYWGGSSGEGLIVAPSADVVDAGHKNGVKVIGTVFMPQTAHGGKMEWLDDLLQQVDDGSYPVVDKLIEVAETYGFDGWFINQETEGTDAEPLTKEHAAQMQGFLSYFKEKAPDLELVYYDSMTVDGKMDWQNALTDKNAAYLKNDEGASVADSMFLNFWWTTDTLAPDELLKASAALAEEQQIDPYDLYAGIDLQSNGYDTPIKWNLFENPDGGTYTSLGLYCPSWSYFSSQMIQDFWKKENKLWVNSKGDPSADMQTEGDTDWRGISTYVVERTALTSLPFVTNFSTGNGYGFYKQGEQISMLDWNNRSISDVLPTYRYIIKDGEGNKLSADLDVGDAYYGGTSLILRGAMKQGVSSDIKMYSASLPVSDKMTFTTTARAKGAEVALDAVLTLDDGSELVLEGDKKVQDEWTTVHFTTSELAGKTIKVISYRLTSGADIDNLQFRFGNITMIEADTEETASVSNVKVLDSEFDEDGMYAGVRISWDSDVQTDYYEVYRINQDQTKSLLGVSNTNSFYINTLPRIDETNKSTFEVVPVNALLVEGTGATVTMDWPDNSIPKAAFTADITLAAPGETITFQSLSSQNTQKVTWTLTGADKESAEGDTVSVTYDKEGVYAVSMKAENESGSSEAAREGYIIITEKASEGLVLLSQGAGTEADAYVNDNEAPQFAVDGDYKKKWCATGSAPHEITLDLGSVKTVSAVDVYHAEAGGESADMNTKSYAIYVSEDGSAFEEVRSVTRNTAGTTHDAFAPVKAQYVKLVVNKPTQGSDSAARIYEVEVYGLEDTLE
ncbi:MAG: discoidin domain-containing protein [Lachnospiraceae bacterium]|nr:discoidin domain-containing protein [Lachnospiraceae bacterium]